MNIVRSASAGVCLEVQMLIVSSVQRCAHLSQELRHREWLFNEGDVPVDFRHTYSGLLGVA
jgi:hypothetical protein